MADSRFCLECGNRFLPTAKFCHECGARRADATADGSRHPRVSGPTPWTKAGIERQLRRHRFAEDIALGVNGVRVHNPATQASSSSAKPYHMQAAMGTPSPLQQKDRLASPRLPLATTSIAASAQDVAVRNDCSRLPGYISSLSPSSHVVVATQRTAGARMNPHGASDRSLSRVSSSVSLSVGSVGMSPSLTSTTALVPSGSMAPLSPAITAQAVTTSMAIPFGTASPRFLATGQLGPALNSVARQGSGVPTVGMGHEVGSITTPSLMPRHVASAASNPATTKQVVTPTTVAGSSSVKAISFGRDVAPAGQMSPMSSTRTPTQLTPPPPESRGIRSAATFQPFGRHVASAGQLSPRETWPQQSTRTPTQLTSPPQETRGISSSVMVLPFGRHVTTVGQMSPMSSLPQQRSRTPARDVSSEVPQGVANGTEVTWCPIRSTSTSKETRGRSLSENGPRVALVRQRSAPQQRSRSPIRPTPRPRETRGTSLSAKVAPFEQHVAPARQMSPMSRLTQQRTRSPIRSTSIPQQARGSSSSVKVMPFEHHVVPAQQMSPMSTSQQQRTGTPVRSTSTPQEPRGRSASVKVMTSERHVEPARQDSPISTSWQQRTRTPIRATSIPQEAKGRSSSVKLMPLGRHVVPARQTLTMATSLDQRTRTPIRSMSTPQETAGMSSSVKVIGFGQHVPLAQQMAPKDAGEHGAHEYDKKHSGCAFVSDAPETHLRPGMAFANPLRPAVAEKSATPTAANVMWPPSSEPLQISSSSPQPRLYKQVRTLKQSSQPIVDTSVPLKKVEFVSPTSVAKILTTEERTMRNGMLAKETKLQEAIEETKAHKPMEEIKLHEPPVQYPIDECVSDKINMPTAVAQAEAARQPDIPMRIEELLLHKNKPRLEESIKNLCRKYGGQDVYLSPDNMEDLINSLANQLGIQREKGLANIRDMFWHYDFTSDGYLNEEEALMLVSDLLKAYHKSQGLANKTIHNIRYDTLEDNYTDLQKLSSGAQGAVYLATKLPGRQERVIKFYDKSNKAMNEADVVTEFSLLKSLDHPKIARYFDLFQDSKNMYVVQEPYHGGDFSSAVAKAKGAGVNVTYSWLGNLWKQAIEGLVYLHSQHVIHQDIKEGNLMISEKNNWEHPKVVVVDFGLADSFSAASRHGGSPGYMPPEVWETGMWTPRGDVFSMGVTMYRMVSGQFPFGEEGFLIFSRGGSQRPNEWQEKMKESTLKCQLLEPVPPLLAQMLNVPGNEIFYDLLKQMLRKERRSRPSFNTVLQDPWFREVANTNHEIDPASLSKLASFHHKKELYVGLLADLASKENLSQLKALSEIFVSMDTDGNGLISNAEARQALEGKLAPEKIEELIATLIGSHGMIPYTVFMGHMLARKVDNDAEMLWIFFKEIDKNGNGVLDKSELEELLQRPCVAEVMENKSAEALLHEMGKSSDGTVSWEEFRKELAPSEGYDKSLPVDTFLSACMSSEVTKIDVEKESSLGSSNSSHDGLTDSKETQDMAMSRHMSVGERWLASVTTQHAQALKKDSATASSRSWSWQRPWFRTYG